MVRIYKMFCVKGIMTIFGNHNAIFRQVLGWFQMEIWVGKKIVDYLTKQLGKAKVIIRPHFYKPDLILKNFK